MTTSIVRASQTLLLGAALAPMIAVAQVTVTGSFSQLTTNPSMQFDPAISGDLVVFTDRRNGNEDVYCVDVATGAETQITTETTAQRLQDVSGNTIVYSDGSNSGQSVAAYDYATGSRQLVDQGSNPAIDGSLVAYEVGPSGAHAIQVTDLSTGATFAPSTGATQDRGPAVDGRNVAYQRSLDGTTGWEVVVQDLDTGVITLLGAGKGVDLDGSTVVYEATAVGRTDLDVHIYDIGSGATTRIDLPGDQRIPHVSGDVIAFDDQGGVDSDVVLYHIPTGHLHRVTGAATADFLNDIDGNRIVYTSDAAGNFDIWMYEFTIDVPGGGGCDGSTNRSTPEDLCSGAASGAVHSSSYVRERGAPVEHETTFAASAGRGAVAFINDGCASAVVRLNGERILSPNDLNRNVDCRLAVVDLLADNTITVKLRSKPGCSLTVNVFEVSDCGEPPPPADCRREDDDDDDGDDDDDDGDDDDESDEGDDDDDGDDDDESDEGGDFGCRDDDDDEGDDDEGDDDEGDDDEGDDDEGDDDEGDDDEGGDEEGDDAGGGTASDAAPPQLPTEPQLGCATGTGPTGALAFLLLAAWALVTRRRAAARA